MSNAMSLTSDEIPLTPRQERIQELECNIRNKQIKSEFEEMIQKLKDKWIPDEEFLGVTDFQELYKKFNGHYRAEFYHVFSELVTECLKNRSEPTISRKILRNIECTRESRARLLGEVYGDLAFWKNPDPALQTFWLIRDVTEEYPWDSIGFDRGTWEMWLEIIDNFIEWQEDSFLQRTKLFDLDFDWKNCPSSLTMEEQYVLLQRISMCDNNRRKKILAEIRAILPSYSGASWNWSQVREIVDKSTGV